MKLKIQNWVINEMRECRVYLDDELICMFDGNDKLGDREMDIIFNDGKNNFIPFSGSLEDIKFELHTDKDLRTILLYDAKNNIRLNGICLYLKN